VDPTHSAPVDPADGYGLVKVDVADGGTITVDGNIVAETGAKVDVSGTSATVWQTPGNLNAGNNLWQGAKVVSVTKDSNGGSLLLVGEQLLFTHATLSGGPGGAGARGGDLTIASNRYSRNGNITKC